jgi:hypothetical protein
VTTPRTRRTALRTAAVAAAVVLPLTLAGPASARPLAAGHGCLPVALDGVGQDLGGFHTKATLSAEGVPVATSEAFFTPGAQVGTVLAFTGPITFTPVVGPGTLTAQVAGTVDLATGTFTAASTSLVGTRLLKKVTGRLSITGVEAPDGSFTETVTGRLCR